MASGLSQGALAERRAASLGRTVDRNCEACPARSQLRGPGGDRASGKEEARVRMKSADPDRRRIVSMQGGHNFRDLGGYTTRDGRHVGYGLVFRSGTLSELSDSDHAILKSLNLSLICDLRSTNERSRKPSRLPDPLGSELWSRDHEISQGDLTRTVVRPGATAEAVRAKVIETYRALAHEQAPSYRDLYLHIAQGRLPLLFHCAAGKDRTGIAAALLLDILGVEREEVISDYVLTDHYFERGCELITKDPFGEPFAQVDPAVWAPLMRADPAYIATMFEMMEDRHGGSTGFARQVLGLNETDIAALRKHLLV